MTEFDVIDAFRAAAAARGIDLPAQLDTDGTLRRCGTTEKPHARDAAYLLHMDGIPAGGFENHRDGAGWENWCAKTDNQMSDLERREHQERMAAAKRARDAELEERRKKAREIAEGTWHGAQPADPMHPYLVKKGIKPNGARQKGDKLVLYAQDENAKIHTMQTTDASGEKRFLSGGKKSGCYFVVATNAAWVNAPTVCVAEGFATGASVHEATGLPVLVAFDCGNLEPVARALRRMKFTGEIVICADDDTWTEGNPGQTKAAAAAAAVGGTTILPVFGPDRQQGQTDFNDLAQVKGTAAVAALFKPFLPSAVEGFVSAADRIAGEDGPRVEDSRHILTFGVEFLNQAMVGITRQDVVLIGADSGVGKTFLAMNIAVSNCIAGRRVHYFALEAEDREIERRALYKEISNLYYRHNHHQRPARIRYIEWRAGRLELTLAPFMAQAKANLREKLRNLQTYYRKESFFTSGDFVRLFKEIQSETDMVVLDHFHFLDSKEPNEIKAAQFAVKQIRDSAMVANRPVVVIGHTRKADGKNASLIPKLDDFRGAGDLAKLATKAIMIAPDYATEGKDATTWSTLIQAVKCRQDSSVCRYVAQNFFDTKIDTYSPLYRLGRIFKEWKEIDHEKLPEWYRGNVDAGTDNIRVGA